MDVTAHVCRLAAAAVLACAISAHTNASSGEPAQQPGDHTALRTCHDTLSRLLCTNVLPFWYPGVIDRQHGGYVQYCPADGVWSNTGSKALVDQARILWFFSRAHRAGVTTNDMLAAARHGFAFMRDKMWDAQHGGFFASVDDAGATPIDANKRTYGQAFALYALSEYAGASGDPAARELASTVFNLLDVHAHDAVNGGYYETLTREWQQAPPVSRGMPGDAKVINTHLHVMEAFTPFYVLTSNQVVRERLNELILIQTGAMLRKTAGMAAEKYARDWTPLPGQPAPRNAYGDDMETIWLVMDAARAAGIKDQTLLDSYTAVAKHTLRFGYDTVHGGVYTSGLPGMPADNRAKVWWPQAETLNGALSLFLRTRDPAYLAMFTGTLGWIDKHQADWRGGEWFDTILPDGTADMTRPRASMWKGPYHTGRALMRSMELLARD